MTDELKRLVDRSEISETITRYFNSLDLRDWDLMRATLAEEIEVDFSELFGDPVATHESADFVDFARGVLSGFQATQHISPNHVISIEGDRATASAGMYAWHKVPSDAAAECTFTLRGRYDIGLERTAEGWRMNLLHMSVWDEDGNKGVYDIAGQRFAALQAELR
jgi:hypothetical protein